MGLILCPPRDGLLEDFGGYETIQTFYTFEEETSSDYTTCDQSGDSSWRLVHIKRRQFLCEDVLSYIKEFLPDNKLLESRLVCRAWARQDAAAWRYIVECIKEYKRSKPGVLTDALCVTSDIAVQSFVKASGICVILGGVAMGLGSMVLAIACADAMGPAGAYAGMIVMCLGVMGGEQVSTLGWNIATEPYNIGQTPGEEWEENKKPSHDLMEEVREEILQECGDYVMVENTDELQRLVILHWVNQKFGEHRGKTGVYQQQRQQEGQQRTAVFPPLYPTKTEMEQQQNFEAELGLVNPHTEKPQPNNLRSKLGCARLCA